MIAVRKVYVEVAALFNIQGGVIPQTIQWEDGTKYEIDRVLDVRRAASLKAGGSGIRYTVQIRGRESYVWYEDSGKWFVEAKQ